MIYNFRDKNVFISGGTHGIGLECALQYAKFGANIISFSRDKQKIDKLKKKLKKFKKIKFLIEQGDILDKKFPEKFAKKVIKKFNSVDILIHNVGGGGRWGNDEPTKSKIETWFDVFNKNNFGLIEFTKFFLPIMKKKKWGRVIAISSICGMETTKNDRPWFSGSKSFQNAVIKNYSKKENYVRKNITFNSISPGPIMIKNTGWEKIKKTQSIKYRKALDAIPLGRFGKPEDVANCCMFLSSSVSSYINGINLVVDGGISNRI